ncbi:MAG: hypothetical protein AAF431_18905 [Pseudomonadota bacterium]
MQNKEAAFELMELSQLMQERLPAGGVLIPERRMHMEVMDEITANVWMSIDEVSQDQFHSFELEENWRKVGRGTGAMDQALFRHSPNAADEAVREQIINGLRFINVAQPAAPKPVDGLVEIMVNKAHVIGFESGREVSVLNKDGQYYVEVVGDHNHDNELDLHESASIQRVQLEEPWVVELPLPTQTFWLMQKDMRSFQGPVAPPPEYKS